MTAPTGRPWPVGDLTQYIRERLEADPALGQLWIQGEVTNVFRARSGHCYFTLRDDEGQLKAALFKAQAARSRYMPVDGDEVIVFGKVSLYPRDGTIQIYAELVERAGAGLDQLRLELLRRQLEAEGLFDPGRKRPIPGFPRRIGVVTSPDGSVWHDIQHVVARRYPLAELVLAPSAVQGEHAPDQIAAALATIARQPSIDVVIVGRGGGSAEDLEAFNSEAVARAVFACPVPTISAVGHETDWSVCDLVADVRAPTPSAAAEIATPSGVALLEAIFAGQRRLHDAALGTLGEGDSRSTALRQRLTLRSPQGKIDRHRDAVSLGQQRMERAVSIGLRLRSAEITARSTVLAALSPAQVLARGYAAVSRERDGAVVGAANDVTSGDRIAVRTGDGRFIAVVGGGKEPPSVARSPSRKSGGGQNGQNRAGLLLPGLDAWNVAADSRSATGVGDV